MRQGVLIVALLGTLAGVVYLIEAFNYPLGTMAQPGAGFYPLIIGSLLLVSLAGVSVEAWRARATEPAAWPAGPNLWRLAAVV
ncbi:MAG: hypothetical protein ACYC4L_19635, partial [Chloroflexota bacterium]